MCAANAELSNKLREAEWHRNAKGLFGKLKKRTGIGKKLRKCETRYRAVDWYRLEGGRWVGDLVKRHHEQALQMAKAESAENVEKVKALRKAVEGGGPQRLDSLRGKLS